MENGGMIQEAGGEPGALARPSSHSTLRLQSRQAREARVAPLPNLSVGLCSTLPDCYDRLQTSTIMPTLIPHPTRIESAGSKPKIIEEYVGRVNTATAGISVAHMRSPEGWQEPGQTPEFDEYTLVLRGKLRVKHTSGELDVAAGQAVIT